MVDQKTLDAEMDQRLAIEALVEGNSLKALKDLLSEAEADLTLGLSEVRSFSGYLDTLGTLMNKCRSLGRTCLDLQLTYKDKVTDKAPKSPELEGPVEGETEDEREERLERNFRRGREFQLLDAHNKDLGARIQGDLDTLLEAKKAADKAYLDHEDEDLANGLQAAQDKVAALRATINQLRVAVTLKTREE